MQLSGGGVLSIQSRGNAVLKDVLMPRARDLGPSVLEARNVARDQGRVRDGQMKPGWHAHGLQRLRRAKGTSLLSPSHTTTKGTVLGVTAGTAGIGRAGSSTLLSCTGTGLLGRLGVGLR